MAGGLKKYKSKIISFLLLEGKASGHDIDKIKLLSVILKRHKATGMFFNSEISVNLRIFLLFLWD